MKRRPQLAPSSWGRFFDARGRSGASRMRSRSARPPRQPLAEIMHRRRYQRCLNEPSGSSGRTSALRERRGRKRNSRATSLRLLNRPSQSTLPGHLHKPNRSVWSGFRPDMSGCAWRRSLVWQSFNLPFPEQFLLSGIEWKRRGRQLRRPYYATKARVSIVATSNAALKIAM
jgi:hypothetical protein